MLEFEAGCIWTGYWLDAVDSGDTDARDQALAVLEEIPTWPALNSTDGGGVVDAWTRNAELAAAGDVQGGFARPDYTASLQSPESPEEINNHYQNEGGRLLRRSRTRANGGADGI